MKKVCTIFLTIIVTLFIILIFKSYSSKDEFQVNMHVPAGTELEYIYSDTEIKPTKSTIKFINGQGLGDTSVVLKPIEPEGEEFCAVGYLTSGMSEKAKVKKGTWYKVGVKVSNLTNEEKNVGIIIDGIEVRIE